MIKDRPETLREIPHGEEPMPNEIVWNTGDRIENIDQARLATAVMKRLRKALKITRTDTVEDQYRSTAKRLEEWMKKKNDSSRSEQAKS